MVVLRVRLSDGQWRTRSQSPTGEVTAARRDRRPPNVITINVSDTPIGPPGTVARYLYRRVCESPRKHGSGQRPATRQRQHDDRTACTDTTGDLPGDRRATPTDHGAARSNGRRREHSDRPDRDDGAQPLSHRSAAAALQLLATIADNTTTTYTDTTADASLGAAPPAIEHGAAADRPCTCRAFRAAPARAAAVTARKLYRRSGGAGLRLRRDDRRQLDDDLHRHDAERVARAPRRRPRTPRPCA